MHCYCMQYMVNENTADWSKELRDMPLLTARPLQDWLCVYPSRNAAEAREFIAAAERVSRGFSIHWTRPYELVLYPYIKIFLNCCTAECDSFCLTSEVSDISLTLAIFCVSISASADTMSVI